MENISFILSFDRSKLVNKSDAIYFLSVYVIDYMYKNSYQTLATILFMFKVFKDSLHLFYIWFIMT